MIAALGLLAGIVLGIIFQPDVPGGLEPYLPIAVVAALDAVCAAGSRAGRPTGLFLAREGDAPGWVAKGARVFLFGSDHGFMLAGAAALVDRVRGS